MANLDAAPSVGWVEGTHEPLGSPEFQDSSFKIPSRRVEGRTRTRTRHDGASQLRRGLVGIEYDLFFVLSGYLITSQLLAEMDARKTVSLDRFYIKRAFRILPPFGFVLALYVFLPWAREKESLPPLWKLLTFTQNLGLDVANHRTFSHAWSLCIEEQFYLSHKIVFHVAQEWFRGPVLPADGPLMMFVCLASAVGFALLMHLAIERPAFRLRDGLLAKRDNGMAAPLESPPSRIRR